MGRGWKESMGSNKFAASDTVRTWNETDGGQSRTKSCDGFMSISSLAFVVESVY